ncbi:hypothetical protein HK096_000596, partial [Nowakowskiella sp. JEL0078]
MWEENSDDTKDKIAEVWPTTDESAFKFYNTPIITKECKFLQEDMKELSETLYKTKKSRNSKETEVLQQIRAIVKGIFQSSFHDHTAEQYNTAALRHMAEKIMCICDTLAGQL